jgi:hypothetical protein
MRILLLLFFILSIFGSLKAQSCNLDAEGFEGSSNLSPPAGWQIVNSYIGNTNPNTGTQHAGFNTLGDILIVEPLTCPGQICFFWRASGTTSNFDIDVDWSSDNGLSWNNAHKIVLGGSGSPTAYQQTCVNLPENLYPAPFSGILIRFHQSRRVSGSFYLDDVCVDAGNCSVSPTQLRFTLPTACIETTSTFSIQVCATDNSGNVATAYNGSISLSYLQGPGILSGTLSQNAVSGCATFNGLRISNSGSTHQLSATDGVLNGNSTVFDVLSLCPTKDTIRVMSYNLLNFPNGRDDCGTNLVIPARWDTLAIITNYIKPDILMVCELQNEVGADSILNRALNINGVNSYRRAAFVVNQSPAGPSLNNMLFYNSTKMSLYRQSLLRTHLRDISYYTMLMNDPGLSSGSDSVFLDVFVAHLDASAIDSLSRKRGADTLRRYLDTATIARNVLFGGDFNFYRSSESGYLTLLSGTRPLFDPINSPGDWTANAAFAPVHTQATRASSTTSMDCGALGGMDDRFDFILASGPIMNGSNNFEYIPNSYRAVANSGNLFNRSINDALNNSSEPVAVKNALFRMSDHLPVILDLEFNRPAAVMSFESLELKGASFAEGNKLSWRHNSSYYPQRYILQRSDDGIYFNDLVIMDALSDEGYYLDNNPPKNAYYRLKLVAEDNVMKSRIIYLERQLSENILKLFPNPAISILQLELSEDIRIKKVEIFSVSAMLLKSEKTDSNRINIDVSDLSAGCYLISVVDEKGNQHRKLFVKN